MDWIFALLAASTLVWGILLYNRLVADRGRVDAAWSDIDVQLKRRHDLLPKLVTAVRQYADYERTTLSRIAELRAQAEQLLRVADRAGLEKEISGLTHSLFALAESYPELKSSEQFLGLQHNISEVENHIQMARRYYNGAVRIFNTRIESFPDLLVARPCGFTPRDYFDMDV